MTVPDGLVQKMPRNHSLWGNAKVKSLPCPWPSFLWVLNTALGTQHDDF